jgi:beta-lactamase class A
MDVDVDSETFLYEQVGGKMPIKQLMFQMITRSSNLATNILIELVDAKNVTATMRELGAHDVEVLRGVEDLKAFNKGLSNSTTAYDLMKIFEAIGMDKIISEEVCDEMMTVLFDQYFNDIIPAYLPAKVKVAHKTGSITGVQHDSGIVVLPNGHKFVLVLLSKDLDNKEKGVETLALISKKVYEYVIAEKDHQK